MTVALLIQRLFCLLAPYGCENRLIWAMGTVRRGLGI